MQNKNLCPDFEKMSGMIPAIVIDFHSKDVLMLCYMNEEAWNKTTLTRKFHYYSRSKKMVIDKKVSVHSIIIDCDFDAVMVRIKNQNFQPICHLGNKSCFFDNVIDL